MEQTIHMTPYSAGEMWHKIEGGEGKGYTWYASFAGHMIIVSILLKTKNLLNISRSYNTPRLYVRTIRASTNSNSILSKGPIFLQYTCMDLKIVPWNGITKMAYQQIQDFDRFILTPEMFIDAIDKEGGFDVKIYTPSLCKHRE